MIMMNYKIDSMDWGEIIQLPSSRALRSTAHVIGGRYPCRSVAYVPRLILNEFNDAKKINVLDPFMGSGTTAVETISRRFNSFGLEVDPFARLITEVSTHGFTDGERDEIERIHNIISEKFPNCQPKEIFAPKTKNIEYWFDDVNFNDLLKLKTLIHELANEKSVKRFFLAVLADIIRAASKAERQSLKPYISKKYTKTRNEVFPTYIKAFKNYFNAIHTESEFQGGTAVNWINGDATSFKTRNKMDVAITSPPYINAMDYVRCIKLESAWIGTGDDDIFSDVRKKQLGEQARTKQAIPNSLVNEIASPHLSYLEKEDNPRFKTALSYFQDMHDNLVCVNSALKKGALYHVIIGNSVIRSKEVETHKIIADLSEELGYKWDGYFCYPIKDHRTSLPRNGNGGKISVEHVISLRKL